MEKTYEEIAKELQTQIDERKEADRIAELEGAARAELERLNYTGSNLDNAFEILRPFLVEMEHADAARAKTIHFHGVVSSARDSGKTAPKRRFFK